MSRIATHGVIITSGIMMLTAPLARSESPPAIPLGGELVAEYEGKAASPKVVVAARAGWCYTVRQDWTRSVDDDNDELFEDFVLMTYFGLPGASLQRYQLETPTGTGSEANDGVCVDKSGKLSISFFQDAQRAGGDVSVRVYAWDRSAPPQDHRGRLQVVIPDYCDAETRASFFLAPVPGTIAYYEGEPVLVTSRYNDGSPAQTVDIRGERGNGASREPSEHGARFPSTIPATVRDRLAERFDESNICGPDRTSKQSQKLEACFWKVDRKMIPRENALQEKLSEAESLFREEQLEYEIDRAEEKRYAAYHKKCGKLMKRVSKDFDTWQAKVEARFAKMSVDELKALAR